MVDLPETSARTGTLWRPIVNFWITHPHEPSSLFPLIELAASLPTSEWAFLSRLKKILSDPQDKQEILEDLMMVRAGYYVWSYNADAIASWANNSEEGPFTYDEIRSWWFSENLRTLTLDQYKRADELLATIDFGPFREFADAKRREWEKYEGHFFLLHLHRNLSLLNKLDTLTDLALRTWTGRPDPQVGWTEDEFGFIQEYYAEQELVLESYDESEDGLIDPFQMQPIKYEQSIGFGLSGLGYCDYVIMRAIIIDFVDEILEHSKFPGVRGSMQCVECGLFVPRRERGYGQLYCSEKCKKKAAKRRYRRRLVEVRTLTPIRH